MNVVPTPATRVLARRMVTYARKESGADAAIKMLRDVQHPEQVPALIGVLVEMAVKREEPKRPHLAPRPTGDRCADCGKQPYVSRGLCRSCYDRHNYAGTIGHFPRTRRRRRISGKELDREVGAA